MTLYMYPHESDDDNSVEEETIMVAHLLYIIHIRTRIKKVIYLMCMYESSLFSDNPSDKSGWNSSYSAFYHNNDGIDKAVLLAVTDDYIVDYNSRNNVAYTYDKTSPVLVYTTSHER